MQLLQQELWAPASLGHGALTLTATVSFVFLFSSGTNSTK